MSFNILFTKSFEKEFQGFPLSVREDMLLLIEGYLAGLRLSKVNFKTFVLVKRVKDILK